MAKEIRKLTIEDYDDIARVWADSGLSYRPFGRDTRDNIVSEMEREDTAFLGLYIDGQMLAVGLATFDGRKGWINRVAVDPDHRGKGFASEIIMACEQFLSKLGAKVIACLVEDLNTPSMALFQKHGYVYHKDILYFSKRESEDS